MSVDINRETIYSESVDQIEDILGASRTRIVAGDDGFVSIDQNQDPIYEENPSGRGRIVKVTGSFNHVGLTPAMIAAIVKWDRTRPRYRKPVEEKDIPEGLHWFHSERSMTPSIARKMRDGWHGIDAIGPVTLEEFNRRGWEYLAPCERPYSHYIDGDARGEETE